MIDAATNDEIATCERACVQILIAIQAHDSGKATESNEPLRALPLRLAEIPTAEAANFRALTNDPVRGALKAGLKALGREIYRRGGIEAMRTSFDIIAGADGSNFARPASVLDSAWNGVGEGNDRWWS